MLYTFLPPSPASQTIAEAAAAARLIEIYCTEGHQEIGGPSRYQSIRISLRDEGSEGFTLETVRNWDAPLKMRIANEASGRFGQVTRYSLGNHALVTRSGANYVVTNYIQNFRLIATLKSDSSSCQVDVTYPLNEKETIYIMGSRTGETNHFSLISAKDVRCSVKSLGES